MWQGLTAGIGEGLARQRDFRLLPPCNHALAKCVELHVSKRGTETRGEMGGRTEGERGLSLSVTNQVSLEFLNCFKKLNLTFC